MPKGDRAAREGRSGGLTVVDVGKACGVSGRTVSRVVNNDPKVSEKTRARVRAAIAEMGFRPNVAARALRSARSFNICLLTAHYSTHYFAEALRGAAKGCAETGYNLLLQDAQITNKRRQWSSLLDRLRIDGILLLPPLADDRTLLAELADRDIPALRISPADREGSGAIIEADDAMGVRELARAFWEKGHRRFGYIGGPANHGATMVRRNAFFEALLALGASSADIAEWHIEPQDASDAESPAVRNARGGAAAIDALAGMPERPTAVFAFSDEVAAGAISRAQALGLNVPGDLAVAGFDGAEIGVMLHPHLTTIRQPIAEMLQCAVHCLVQPDRTQMRRTFPVAFIARDSS